MTERGLLLTALDGPARGRAWALAGQSTLGRSGDLRVDDPHLSRHHLQVRVRGRSVRVRDASASNPTLLRWGPFGVRLGARWRSLPRGATVRAGAGTYRVRVRPPAKRELRFSGAWLRVLVPLAIAGAMVPMALQGPAWRWALVAVPALAALALVFSVPSPAIGPRRGERPEDIWMAAREGSAFHAEPVWPRRPRALRTSDAAGSGWSVPDEAGARWLAGFLAVYNHPDVLRVTSPWIVTEGEGVEVSFAAAPSSGPGTDDLLVTWGPRPPAWALPLRLPRGARVSAEWARALLPDRRPDGIPDRVDAVPVSTAEVRRAWARPHADLTVRLGVSGDGPVVIDLVEDGPHALVAGTTGAGKSELLTTWLLTLAAGNSPEHLGMVLVDFKGGAAFGPLAALPHCHAVLTDLDPSLTRRALGSLGALLRERERRLAEAGCRDIAEFDAVRPGEMGRLLVVIDEFRALADDHPDVLDRILRLGAQGRSLGIHLVLATQRPAGAVSAELRANMPLRIALRLAEPADSQDILGSSAAAALPRTPGRAILGPSTEFQVAWSGTRSDVEARVRALAARARPHPPLWCPPLPEHVDLGLLPPGTVALVDHPEDLAQRPWVLPRSNLLIAGPPGSGRTTAALAAVAAALGQGDEVWLVTADRGAAPPARSRFGGVVHVSQTRLVQDLLAHAAEGPRRTVILDDVDLWSGAVDGLHGPGSALSTLTDAARTISAAGSRMVACAGAESASARWAAGFRERVILSGLDHVSASMSGLPRSLHTEARLLRPGTGYLLPDGDELRFGVGTPPPEVGPHVSPRRFLPLPTSRPARATPAGLVVGHTADGALVLPVGTDVVVVGTGPEARRTVGVVRAQATAGTVLEVTPGTWATGWSGELGRIRDHAAILVVRPDLTAPAGMNLSAALEPGGPGYAALVWDGAARAVRVPASVEDVGAGVDDVRACLPREHESDSSQRGEDSHHHPNPVHRGEHGHEPQKGDE